MKAVDSETHDKTSKLESYIRRLNNCIKEFKIRSGEKLEQENINESIGESVETVVDEQSGENSTAKSHEREVEIQLNNLRDEINKHDQNIADNVITIGEMLIQAKACVKKIKKLKWQDWLAENIRMPRSTASRYVKCTERFKNVAPAQHFEFSKLTVSKMFELLSVPKDKLDQFLKDAKEKDIKIQDMTKNELRDIIKGWKQNNIPQKPKEKFSVRLSIAEEDRTRFTEFLQGLFNRRDLSDDSLKSVEAAIKSLTMANTAKVGDTESGVKE